MGGKQKKPRASRKRSFVWDHYESFVNTKDKHKSICRYCDKEYFSDTKVHGTSTLHNHLKYYQKYPAKKPSRQTNLTIQTGDGDERKMVGWRFEQQSTMKSKYDKYYGSLGKCNMLTLVASMLDPTRKKDYVEVLLVDFYDDYVRIHSPPESSKSSDPSSLINKRSTAIVMEPSVVLKQKVRMEMKMRKAESGSGHSKSELDRYLKEETEDEDDKFDILNWWKVNSPRFPILFLVARDVLAIPISIVASDSVSSTSGKVLDAFRSSLTPTIIESLICTQNWLRGDPVDVAENWKELQRIEEDLIENANRAI